MSAEAVEITYRFASPKKEFEDLEISVSLDGETLDRHRSADGPQPEWAKVEHHRCEHCPLGAAHEWCPAALSLAELNQGFGHAISYTEATVTVRTKERMVTADTTMQKGIQSLLGLYMATSGCPTLAKFKPMARFHQPFAGMAETLFRSASAYLLAQYFRKQRGGEAEFDFAGLHRLYDEVHAINWTLARRIRGTNLGDANINALGLLDLYAHEAFHSIKDNLTRLSPLFGAYFGPDTSAETAKPGA